MDKINYIKIGKRIKKYREKLGMTQAFVAEEIDVSNSYISGIETGKSICSLATLHKLSILLKFNIDTVINGINETNANANFSEILQNIPKNNRQLYIEICQDIGNRFKNK